MKKRVIQTGRDNSVAGNNDPVILKSTPQIIRGAKAGKTAKQIIKKNAELFKRLS